MADFKTQIRERGAMTGVEALRRADRRILVAEVRLRRRRQPRGLSLWILSEGPQQVADTISGSQLQ